MRSMYKGAVTATSVVGLAAASFVAIPEAAWADAAPSAMSADADSLTTVDIASSSAIGDVAGGAGFRGTERPAARAQMPSRWLSMSVGTGQLIVLPRPMSGVFIADDKVADVNVKSPTQLYLFGKAAGQTSIYATDKSGAVVWSSQVRVGSNIADVGSMLRTAMPEQDISVTNMSGMILLTGTVVAPKDAEEAQRLTELFTAGGVQVINHLKIATPQQVSLHVKIAEVSRSISRQIGVNLANRDGSGGFLFGVDQGDAGTIKTNVGAQDPASGAKDGDTVFSFNNIAGTTLGFAGHALGLDLLATLQLNENNGLVTTLAEPTLVALSGETASFLAGGEIPIPQSQGLGTVSVEFKQYGVSLSFTPTVLSGGRISMRVRPEVSQLSDAGSVKLNGFTIPALTTRRAETTVELGSGQSFVIGGLLQNSHNNSTDKAPILGDLPILGALFRSNSFKKSETELMIVVTPYIVKPVDAARIALPTDGYRSPMPVQRILGDRPSDSVSGASRPMPHMAPAPAAPVAPTVPANS
ncbi:type II and III secretion system protein family protein [Sphingomonas sp. BIUV-7]|uniref:Type II and III secretion system protein family protein n=1 Tax=Sphingomonas natans TaxID=3063330 RepID=A0ABT8Y4B9_9SPHN|nr:type II and III secretion system protein family protein [Sphingomonas sp. BIUV-7]MDO6413170.1 type II and III secretion system protein family protein [Sphingomonas sp. BIUV-7]